MVDLKFYDLHDMKRIPDDIVGSKTIFILLAHIPQYHLVFFSYHASHKTSSQPYPYIKAESRVRTVFWASINSKMFAAGISADVAIIISLQTLNISRCQLATKVWILTIRLLHDNISNII